MSPGVTAVGKEIYDLHMIIFWICYDHWRWRIWGDVLFHLSTTANRRGVTPATFHESTKVEIAWTVVPFFILIGMAVPATTTLLEIYDNDDADMDSLSPVTSGSGNTNT